MEPETVPADRQRRYRSAEPDAESGVGGCCDRIGHAFTLQSRRWSLTVYDEEDPRVRPMVRDRRAPDQRCAGSRAECDVTMIVIGWKSKGAR
jgi:hypothetical protein